MSLVDPLVLSTLNDDGSAEFTVSIADDDHKFSVTDSTDGDYAIIEFEETLSWRGNIQTAEPDEDVWKMVMSSEEMTSYLDDGGISGIRRER
jgi:hypothetical protein